MTPRGQRVQRFCCALNFRYLRFSLDVLSISASASAAIALSGHPLRHSGRSLAGCAGSRTITKCNQNPSTPARGPRHYYDWATRAPSDRALTDAWLIERIKQIWAENRKVYGAPRIHAELRLAHVERLMREAGISGLVARKRGRTTIRVPGVRVADDLVERRFRPEAPNVLWIADINLPQDLGVLALRRRRPGRLQPPHRRLVEWPTPCAPNWSSTR